ncbi:MAG: N-acetylmuramoyl-L-alanine amidase [Balneolaceae bacterium]|nr:N-acetylmuramoyl-L-alanine amidase [Balneolaceae bacterium]
MHLKKLLLLAGVLVLANSAILTAQSNMVRVGVSQSDSLYLNIVIPETDTVQYSYSRYRIGANTHPNAKAYVNGKEVKVYETGAFIDMIEHTDDSTDIHIRVAMNGEELNYHAMLVRPTSEMPEFYGKVISNLNMKPDSDLWLTAGELLEVQFVGTPGESVVFNIDGFKRNIPMQEVPEEEAGYAGLYRGYYKVLDSDLVYNQFITFKMKKGLFGYEKVKSEHTVTFNGTPRVAEVVVDDAYLNIGMGTDRLGGARYGYLEKGVLLNIDGQKKGNYRVRLSEKLSAWIPMRFVELKQDRRQPVSSLTGNIRVSGRFESDLIRVSLSEKLPYITWQDINPNMIYVDIFGATSNTNWKIKHKSSEGIKKVNWVQVEDHRFRLEIELNHSQNWGYSVGYGWGSQMNIEINRPPVITNPLNPLAGRVISVDAGHGGDNRGSLGAGGFVEKDVTLQISMILKDMLEAEGAEVVLPRTDDSYVYMSERREMTLDAGADLLVSIHTNSIGYGSNPLDIRGTGSFYKHIAFKPLAEIMYDKMLELGLADYGLTGSFNFTLNAPIEFPNVLVETAFISNPEEEILLIDPEFQHRMAMQIVEGLKEFYLKHGTIESLSEMPDK